MTNHHEAFKDCVRWGSPGGELLQPPVEDSLFYILLLVFVAFWRLWTFGEDSQNAQEPTYHTSTPRISNLTPSSERGSFPKVWEEALTPFSRPESTHSP